MDTNTRDFLNRIVNDPDFRARVEKDPMGALKSMGVPVKPGDVPKGPITLPSNEEIRALLVLEPHWDRFKACQSVISVVGWQTP